MAKKLTKDQVNKTVTIQDLINKLKKHKPNYQVLRYRFEIKELFSVYTEMHDHKREDNNPRWGTK